MTITRKQYNQILGLPEEEDREEATAKLQAFGPGQLNTYSRFIEGRKNSFITYTTNITQPHKYKIILSDKCLSAQKVHPSVLELMNAMLVYSEVYLWEGSQQSFSTLTPMTNANQFWLRSESIVGEPKEKITQSLVQQGYALEDFYIIDSEKLLQLVEKVIETWVNGQAEKTEINNSIFSYAPPFNFEQMLAISRVYEMNKVKSEWSLIIRQPTQQCVFVLKSNPHIGNIHFELTDENQLRDILQLTNLKRVRIELKCKISSTTLSIPDNFCEELIIRIESDNYQQTLKIYSNQKQVPCLKKLALVTEHEDGDFRFVEIDTACTSITELSVKDLQYFEHSRAGLTSITSLVGTYMTVQSSQLFEFFPHLQKLEVDRISLDTDPTKQLLPSLTTLSLDFDWGINESLEKLISTFPNITHLTLKGDSSLTDKKNMSDKLFKLDQLPITAITIKDVKFESTENMPKNLKKIKLKGCTFNRSEDINEQSCSNLKEDTYHCPARTKNLDIYGCTIKTLIIDDPVSLKTLSINSTVMETLDLRKCINLNAIKIGLYKGPLNLSLPESKQLETLEIDQKHVVIKNPQVLASYEKLSRLVPAALLENITTQVSFKYLSELQLAGTAALFNKIVQTISMPQLNKLEFSLKDNDAHTVLHIPDSVFLLKISTKNNSLELKNGRNVMQLEMTNDSDAGSSLTIDGMKNVDTMSIGHFTTIVVKDCKSKQCSVSGKRQKETDTIPITIQESQIEQLIFKRDFYDNYVYKVSIEESQIENIDIKEDALVNIVSYRNARIGLIQCDRQSDISIPQEIAEEIPVHTRMSSKQSITDIHERPIHDDTLQKAAWSFSLRSHATPDANTANPAALIKAGEGNIEIYSHPSVKANYYRIQVVHTCRYNMKKGSIEFNFAPDENTLERVKITILPLATDTAAVLSKDIDKKPELAVTYMSSVFTDQTWVPLATESALVDPYHAVMIYTNKPDCFLKDGYWSEEQAQLFLRCKNPKGEEIEIFFVYKKGEKKVPPKIPDLDPELKKYLYDTLLQDKYQHLRFLFDASLNPNQKLEKLVDYCHFENIALDINSFQKYMMKPIEIIIEEILERRGVCRHRAQCFFLLARMIGLPVLMIRSNIHDFVEKQTQTGAWKMEDLGGGEPLITIDVNKKSSPFYVPEVAAPVSSSMSTNIAPATTTTTTTTTSASTSTLTTSTIVQSLFGPSVPYLKYKKTFDDLLAPVILTNTAMLKEKALEKPAPLVLLDTADELQRMVQYLTAKEPGNEVRYIHTPSDLKRFFSTYQVKNGKRTKHDGPLKRLIESGGTLVINWSTFTPNQLAAYQSIIDKEATLWGRPIDKQLRVVGLGLKKHAFNKCASFLSRCHEMHLSPAFLDSFKQKTQPVPTPTTATMIINLFGLPDWKEILFGKVIIDGTNYHYQEGKLQEASRKKCSITIINPPKDPEFENCKYHINNTGKWLINNEEVSVPTMSTQTAANDPSYPATVQLHTDAAPLSKREPIFLSIQEWHLLFTQQIFTSAGGKTSDGLLDTYQPDKQYFLIHGTIPASFWEKMIATIKERYPDKNFDFYLSPGAEIRQVEKAAAAKTEETASPIIPPEKILSSSASIVVTNDPDFYEESLKLINPQLNVVHLTPSSDDSDIIFKSSITSQADDSLQFEAIYNKAFLALQKGETVILQGPMPPSLYQAFFPLISGQKKLYVNGKMEDIKGRLLILLPENAAKHLPLENPAQYHFTFQHYKARFSDAEQPLVDDVISFYAMANKIPLGGIGCPPHLNLNFHHLHNCIRILKKNLHPHNPLKSVFHYDFPKKSAEYAYLSVAAKWLFAQNDASAVNHKRLAALLKGKNEAEWINHFTAHPWLWLNCFRGKELRKILGNKWEDVIGTAAGFSTLTQAVCQRVIAEIKKRQAEAKMPLPPVSAPDKQTRLTERLSALLNDAYVPIIFLKGEPGVGKTYTLRHLQEKYKFHKYEFNNSKQLLAWLKNDGQGDIPLLSVDEANFMQPGMLNFLKGIRNGKVHYQGEWYPITPRHKIMLTGNPEYFPGRHYHDFIRDEAVTLYVNQPEEELLRTLLTKHLTNKLPNSTQLPSMIDSLITLYQEVQQYNPTYVYSIRDLESLMERFVLRIKNNEDVNTALLMAAKNEFLGNFIDEQRGKQFIARVAHLCDTSDAYDLALLSANKLERNIIEFKCEASGFKYRVIGLDNIEKTNELPWGMLDKVFHHFPKTDQEVLANKGKILPIILRMILKIVELDANKKIAFPGELATVIHAIEEDLKMDEQEALTNEDSFCKRGILLEGDVGIGKTTLLKTLLEKHGLQYIEINVVEPEIKGTGESSTSEFSKLLIQAFHEGKRVIINELNLDPSLEILLNQLLNGYDPDGNPPKIKGFRVYASQNPSSDEGRRPQSLALKNRNHVHYVPPFSKTGLENLAEYYGVPEHQEFVRAYLDEKDQDPQRVNMRGFFNAMDQHATNKPVPVPAHAVTI